MAGLHVWNFADFKTGQGIIRMGGMNLKGVFTRDRRPKMAAHFLRSRWHRDSAAPAPRRGGRGIGVGIAPLWEPRQAT